MNIEPFFLAALASMIGAESTWIGDLEVIASDRMKFRVGCVDYLAEKSNGRLVIQLLDHVREQREQKLIELYFCPEDVARAFVRHPEVESWPDEFFMSQVVLWDQGTVGHMLADVTASELPRREDLPRWENE